MVEPLAREGRANYQLKPITANYRQLTATIHPRITFCNPKPVPRKQGSALEAGGAAQWITPSIAWGGRRDVMRRRQSYG